MALFTYIDGIPLKDMTHPALLNAMKEHVFFQFMQSGRSGFENGAADVVTNISEWYCHERNRSWQEAEQRRVRRDQAFPGDHSGGSVHDPWC